jgi:hypothetical protein
MLIAARSSQDFACCARDTDTLLGQLAVLMSPHSIIPDLRTLPREMRPSDVEM